MRRCCTNWESVTAKIVDVKKKYSGGGNNSPQGLKFVADVSPASGPPFRTQINQGCSCPELIF
jgi:hypothetical protein